jgi:N-acyl-phosphatidylethanolamine-hydrolysing phospholipase D
MKCHRFAALLALSLACAACVSTGFFAPLFESPRRVDSKVERPFLPSVRLAALWVGHATVLIQLDDKLVLTDPVFTSSVGQLSARLVEPGLDVENVPPLDAVVVSHMHFDHLSLGTLEALEDRVRTLVVPERGLVYVTDFDFPAVELARWQSFEHDGLRITAVPVEHNGMRYGIDRAWMTTSFSGYVIEYRGQSVYFGGDTGYAAELFRETRKRFPRLDLAILPIAPIQPRSFMAQFHIDPDEAVDAYIDLGARWMVPMHFDTFVNSRDDVGDAPRRLREVMRERKLDRDRIALLEIGEQRVFVAASDPAGLKRGRSVER